MKRIIVLSILLAAIGFATILVFPLIVKSEQTRIAAQENMRTEFSEYLVGIPESYIQNGNVRIEKLSENTFYSSFDGMRIRDGVNRVISNFGKRHKIISVSVVRPPHISDPDYLYIVVEDLDNKNVE